jgi:hypothetical protein
VVASSREVTGGHKCRRCGPATSDGYADMRSISFAAILLPCSTLPSVCRTTSRMPFDDARQAIRNGGSGWREIGYEWLSRFSASHDAQL